MSATEFFDGRERLPGDDEPELIAEAAKIMEQGGPKLVTAMYPLDVTPIRDPSMKALAILAASLGWNVRQDNDRAQGGMVAITARNGTQRRLPTNTSIRSSVFNTLFRVILRNALDVWPSSELIEKIIKTVKLDASHSRVMRAAIAAGFDSGWVAEPEPEPEPVPPAERKRQPDPHLTQRIVVPTATVNEPIDLGSEGWEMAPSTGIDYSTLERRPALVSMGPKKKGAGVSQQYISPIMDEITLPNGEVTRICKVCDFTGNTQRIASHYQWHVKRGEAKATATEPKIAVAEVEKETRKWEPKEDRGELARLRRIVADISAVVGRGAIEEAEQRALYAENQMREAQRERDEALARAEKLQGDLRTLRDLLTGLD